MPAEGGQGPGAGLAGARWLMAGGLASFALGLLHAGMVPVGERAYEYFGAPARIVALSRGGSPVPAVVTLAIAAVLLAFGVLAIAAARRSAPGVLRIVLVGVTGVYLLRGALIVPDSIVVRLAGYPPRILLFSGVALLIGIVHAVGLARAWGRLSRAEVPREEPSGSPQTKVNNL